MLSGTLQQFFLKEEVTYDTQQAVVATDAVDLVSLELTPDLQQTEIQAHVGTGSYQGEINAMRGGKWTAVCDLAPAAAGTAPDIGPALKAALGDETIVGGTSVTYDFNDSSPTSIQWVKKSGHELYEVMTGCWVESLSIEASQGGVPKLTFSGGGATFGCYYGQATVSGVHAAASAAITLTTNHGYQFRPGAYIKFGASTLDNAGAGYKVTAHTASGITISPGLHANDALAGAEVVRAFIPSQTLGGTRIGGVSHGCTIDSTSIGFIDSKYTIATGIKARDKNATSAVPVGIFRAGGRTVDVDLTVYALQENALMFGGAHFATQVLRDVLVRLGANTAAARASINTDKTNLKVQAVALADAEIATWKLIGRARQNSAANDEFSLVLD